MKLEGTQSTTNYSIYAVRILVFEPAGSEKALLRLLGRVLRSMSRHTIFRLHFSSVVILRGLRLRTRLVPAETRFRWLRGPAVLGVGREEGCCVDGSQYVIRSLEDDARGEYLKTDSSACLSCILVLGFSCPASPRHST